MSLLSEKRFLFAIIGVMSVFFLSSVVCCALITADLRKYKKKKKKTFHFETKCKNCGYSTNPEFIICPKCGKILNEKGDVE